MAQINEKINTREKIISEIIEKLSENIRAEKDVSAWRRGVKAYALELVDNLAESLRYGSIEPDDLAAPKLVNRALLNGADDWRAYSWGGCALIYDGDIAERLCSPSELKKTRNGDLRPNSSEEWLDVQARALGQAASMVKRFIRDLVASGALVCAEN